MRPLVWSSPIRRATVLVAVVVVLACAAGSIGWALAITAVAGLGFAGYALAPWIGERRGIAARRRDAVGDRADQQHRWALRGDSRGIYGAEGAAATRRISPQPRLDEINGDAGEQPHVAAVAYTAEGLDALLAERPPCWRYAVFASVLVQRRAQVQPRLRDQQLGYAPPNGVRMHTGPELARFMLDVMEQLSVLLGQLEEVMLSQGFLRAFGDLDDEDSADADGIVHAANRLMDLHERLLRLAERSRGVVAPAEHAAFLRYCGRAMDVPLQGYRRFTDEFVERVSEFPDVLRYARGPVEMAPVVLDMDDTDDVLRKVFAGIEKLARGA